MKDFLEKARKTAEKVMDQAGDAMGKAKQFVDEKAEPMKIEWEIAKQKSALENLLLEFGKICYYEHSDEEKTECHSALIETEARIGMLEEELKSLKEEEAKKSEEKATVFCTKCGTGYKDKENYCKKCGTKL